MINFFKNPMGWLIEEGLEPIIEPILLPLVSWALFLICVFLVVLLCVVSFK